MRVFAIDWSGKLKGGEKNTWVAEVADGKLVRLDNGRTRQGVAQHLIDEAARDRRMIVGLDFAFSLPVWFLEERGFTRAQKLWESCAGGTAEEWLSGCEPPFWGRPGKRRPVLESGCDHYRRTEREVWRETGFKPKSVFQIGAAGAVGTGSLRGMPVLHSLETAGFSTWPFSEPWWPLIVEIYPRVLTGLVNKSNAAERAAYLSEHRDSIEGRLIEEAAGSEDAFDAAISALVMWKNLSNLVALPSVEDWQVVREGAIWHPDLVVSSAEF